jgi:sporulation protein YlmC with PRC-barrel domain
MLYSAMSMKGVEVVGSDGPPVGALVDAYVNVRTGVVEWLIVSAAGVGGQYRLIPATELAEYDTQARQLMLKLTAAEAAAAREAPDGIPVMLERMGDAGDGRLHVITTLVGFAVDAVDGTVGRAADFLVDSDGLVIRYLVVDTRDWLPGSDKLVPAEWIESTDWARARIYLKITQARTRACQRASAGSHLLDRQ